ncbi:variant surface antigen E precursor [Rhizophagus irregularis DAOM 181602=DAOM 197198]|nr:variant surface antigen E precursor [Rhizophagus irregularis DAOM 181602=DAOM 197198]
MTVYSSNPLRGRLGFPSTSTDYPPNRIYDDKSVRADLSRDRPEYKYSCYGPAKEEPNLLEGTDFSAEELRVQYYSIMSTNGVDSAYRAGVKDLDERMQGQIDTILRDLRSALTRFDTKRQQLAQQQASSGFAFGQPTQPQQQPTPQRQGTYGTPALGFGASNYNATSSLNYPVTPAQPSPGSIFGGYQQPQQPQQPDPQQQQYLLQMQQQQEMLAQQQQQQQQMLQQQMMQQQHMQQQQPPQPGNTQDYRR